MEKLSVGEIVALISLPFLVAGTAATIWGLANSRVRKFISMGLIVGTSFVSGLVVWSLFWRDYRGTPPKPGPGPVVRTTPTPAPTPQKKKEVPQVQPTPAPEEPPSPPGVPLYASSLDDASARAAYCVVGEVIGESRDGRKVINVTVSQANLSLCNYSSHGPRRVAVKIGIANALPIAGKKSRGILWGPNVMLAEHLNPGETFSLPAPINITIPKRGSVNMANAKFVVQLSNVPYDSNREMRYNLSDTSEAQLAQIGRD
jgi:hypothetical protein